MAADTRDPDSSSQPTQALQDSNPKTYERFGTSSPSNNYASDGGGAAVEAARPQNANLLPGGTINTAGGKVRETSILEAAKTIKLRDFRELHKKPCARESFLVGIGAGFGIGGLRAVMGGLFVFFFFFFFPFLFSGFFFFFFFFFKKALSVLVFKFFFYYFD